MRTPLVSTSFILSLTCGLTSQSVTFAPHVDFGMAQENGQQSVCADFDHDGNLDIANTMEGNNQGKVEVLFGDGQSDFGSSIELSSYVAWGLGTGDFNGDGYEDLAATSYGWAQHGVHIWLNNHSRGFTNAVTISTLGTPPVAVTSGDIDGDGIVDIAAICEGGGYAVDWFHGNGDGTFSTFHVVPNTNSLFGHRIYTGHFDGDTHLDLLATHQQGAMVLLNDPQGTGNLNASSGIPSTDPVYSAAVADLDGDGRDDIVTAGADLRTWHGVGDGSFTLIQSQPTSSGGSSTTLGDIDGDGIQDLLVVGLGGVQIFFGAGGGMFSAPQTVTAGVYPVSGVIGDWNGDGWNDIAITCRNAAISSSYVSIYDQIPPAITATALAFGPGCGSPALGFAPDASGRPILGNQARATISNVPAGIAGVELGFSNQWFGVSPLPLALDVLGMTGCSLLTSSDILGLPTTSASASTRTFALTIPRATSLVGAQVYLQAHALAPGQNLAQLITSNGIAWGIGTR
ncbi:MAG: VCBS repeat-containing protein [Planctomycetota bacterium]